MKGCFRSRWVLCFFHVFFPSARVDIYHHLPRSKKGKLHLEAFPRSNIISLTHPQKIEYLRNGPPKWKDPIAYPVPIVWGIGLYTFNVWPLDAKKQQHIIVLHPVTTRPVITSTRACGARLVCWMHLPFKLDASLWFNRWLNWIVRAYVDVCMFFNMTEQNSWQTLQAPRTNQSPICPTVAPSLQPFLAESGTITRDLRPFVPSSLLWLQPRHPQRWVKPNQNRRRSSSFSWNWYRTGDQPPIFYGYSMGILPSSDKLKSCRATLWYSDTALEYHGFIDYFPLKTSI